jgi:hypothetical protein
MDEKTQETVSLGGCGRAFRVVYAYYNPTIPTCQGFLSNFSNFVQSSQSHGGWIGWNHE